MQSRHGHHKKQQHQHTRSSHKKSGGANASATTVVLVDADNSTVRTAADVQEGECEHVASVQASSSATTSPSSLPRVRGFHAPLLFSAMSVLLTLLMFAAALVLVAVPLLYIEATPQRNTYIGVMLPVLAVVLTLLHYVLVEHALMRLYVLLLRATRDAQAHCAVLDALATRQQQQQQQQQDARAVSSPSSEDDKEDVVEAVTRVQVWLQSLAQRLERASNAPLHTLVRREQIALREFLVACVTLQRAVLTQLRRSHTRRSLSALSTRAATNSMTAAAQQQPPAAATRCRSSMRPATTATAAAALSSRHLTIVPPAATATTPHVHAYDSASAALAHDTTTPPLSLNMPEFALLTSQSTVADATHGTQMTTPAHRSRSNSSSSSMSGDSQHHDNRSDAHNDSDDVFRSATAATTTPLPRLASSPLAQQPLVVTTAAATAAATTAAAAAAIAAVAELDGVSSSTAKTPSDEPSHAALQTATTTTTDKPARGVTRVSAPQQQRHADAAQLTRPLRAMTQPLPPLPLLCRGGRFVGDSVHVFLVVAVTYATHDDHIAEFVRSNNNNNNSHHRVDSPRKHGTADDALYVFEACVAAHNNNNNNSSAGAAAAHALQHEEGDNSTQATHFVSCASSPLPQRPYTLRCVRAQTQRDATLRERALLDFVHCSIEANNAATAAATHTTTTAMPSALIAAHDIGEAQQQQQHDNEQRRMSSSSTPPLLSLPRRHETAAATAAQDTATTQTTATQMTRSDSDDDDGGRSRSSSSTTSSNTHEAGDKHVDTVTLLSERAVRQLATSPLPSPVMTAMTTRTNNAATAVTGGGGEAVSFVLSWRLLPDRPMRLTLLPVNVCDNNNKNDDEQQQQQHHRCVSCQTRVVPVLECLVDDVFCIVTSARVLVDRPHTSNNMLQHGDDDMAGVVVRAIELQGVSIEADASHNISSDDDGDKGASATPASQPLPPHMHTIGTRVTERRRVRVRLPSSSSAT